MGDLRLASVQHEEMIQPVVPQGSNFGSLFFLAYTFYLTVDLRHGVKLFAGYTSLFTVNKNASNTAKDLKHDLIRQWALQ